MYRNHEFGRSTNAGHAVTELQVQPNCIASSQSGECAKAAKLEPKVNSAVTATAHKIRTSQHQQNTKSAVIRRKTIVSKQKAPGKAPGVSSAQQVINRARGTLHGLSTIKRHGNVRVTPSPDYLAVRANFVLGPLVLKVEKSFGRGAKRETKRATATTTQMIGRINLRIVNDKAVLHSIKVQQPKQVNPY